MHPAMSQGMQRADLGWLCLMSHAQLCTCRLTQPYLTSTSAIKIMMAKDVSPVH